MQRLTGLKDKGFKWPVCLFLFLGLTMPAGFAQHQTRFIVKVKPEHLQELTDAETLSSRMKASLSGKVKVSSMRITPLIRTALHQPVQNGLFLMQSNDSPHTMKALQTSGIFEYIEPDHVGFAAGIKHTSFPEDPGFSQQWYLHNDGTFNLANAKEGADIQLLDAWGITQGDDAITVAILDTGISPEHRDFTGRLWVNTRDMATDGKDNDRNGFIDDTIGWDFVNDDQNPYDDHGHGTAVAGIVAANANNGFGFTGIDQQCKLMICKVLDETLSGYYSHWIAAIYYAVNHGARVINFSLGGEEPSRALKEAIDYAESKGVLVVAAMQNFNTDKPYYPAAYSQILAVGATDPDDSRSTRFNNNPSYGSNYGNHIDVVAPGNYIYGFDKSSSGNPGLLWSGTSMSAPIVSGIASLLLGQDPARSPADVKAILYTTAEDQVGDPAEDKNGWDPFYGYGRVNAFAALSNSGNVMVEENLTVYPNPANTIVTLYLRLPISSAIQITLIDMQGKAVLNVYEPEKAARVFRGQVNVSQLLPGVYIVKAIALNKVYFSRLVVIRE